MIKKQVTKSVKAGYQGSTHTNVDTSALVWRIASKARELQLQRVVPRREGNLQVKPVPDLHAVGLRKFETSSLATFNKKIIDMKQGITYQLEEDEIAPCRMGVDTDVDQEEPSEDTSVLHDDD